MLGTLFSSCGTLSVVSNCWLNLYRRSSSRRRPMASSVCFRARSDSSLAITAVVRKARSATQFCVSEIVKVPIGGKK